MRGKVIRALECAAIIRITPAYAGKSTLSRRVDKHNKDHPRLCGEKIIHHIVRTVKLGSPPPMRGKGVTDEEIRHTHGITPAYAGKSDFSHRAGKLFRDHPRLCGEKFKIAFVLFALSGSPPPMRGKVNSVICYVIVSRITPAYAGKRLARNAAWRKKRDHPRLCGEKLIAPFVLSMI